jgi:hypothetical protein
MIDLADFVAIAAAMLTVVMTVTVYVLILSEIRGPQ